MSYSNIQSSSLVPVNITGDSITSVTGAYPNFQISTNTDNLNNITGTVTVGASSSRAPEDMLIYYAGGSVASQIFYANDGKTMLLLGNPANNSNESSMYYNNAGLFKSTNNGSTWSKIQLPDNVMPTFCLVNSDLTNICLFTYGAQQILKSFDGGATWQVTNINDPTYEFQGAYNQVTQSVAIKSNDDFSVILTASRYVTYITTDGGVTWSQVQTLPSSSILQSSSDSFSSMLASSDLSTIMVISYKGVIYKSTDSGSTWTTSNVLTTTYPTGSGYFTTVNTPDMQKILVNVSNVSGVQLLLSTDGGQTFSTINPPATVNQYYANSDLSKIFFQTNIVNNANPIYVSSDFGATWTLSTLNVPNTDTSQPGLKVMAFSDNSQNIAALLLDSSDSIISFNTVSATVSNDSGSTWKSLNDNLYNNLNSNNDTLLYSTVDNVNIVAWAFHSTYLLISNDAGLHWGKCQNSSITGVVTANILSNNNLICVCQAGPTKITILSSNDNGYSFSTSTVDLASLITSGNIAYAIQNSQVLTNGDVLLSVNEITSSSDLVSEKLIKISNSTPSLIYSAATSNTSDILCANESLSLILKVSFTNDNTETISISTNNGTSFIDKAANYNISSVDYGPIINNNNVYIQTVDSILKINLLNDNIQIENILTINSSSDGFEYMLVNNDTICVLTANNVYISYSGGANWSTFDNINQFKSGAWLDSSLLLFSGLTGFENSEEQSLKAGAFNNPTIANQDIGIADVGAYLVSSLANINVGQILNGYQLQVTLPSGYLTGSWRAQSSSDATASPVLFLRIL